MGFLFIKCLYSGFLVREDIERANIFSVRGIILLEHIFGSESFRAIALYASLGVGACH